MKAAEFIAFKNGYYRFDFDDGETIDFDQIHPKILGKFKLDSDKQWRNKRFMLAFSEIADPKDEDSIIYRIEQLRIINEDQ